MSKGRTRQLASHDVSVAFFHAWLERGVWVKPPKDLRLSDDWLWYVVKALYGMRVRCTPRTSGPCCRQCYALLTAVTLDSLAGWHGDDFYTESEPGELDEVDEMILASFKAKVLPRLVVHWGHPHGSRRWHVSLRSRVRDRVRHEVPETLVVGSAMCWSY